MRAFVLRMSAFVALGLAVTAMWIGLHVASTGGWILATFPMLAAVACGWAAAECMHGAAAHTERRTVAADLHALLIQAENLEAACHHHPALQARVGACVDQLAAWVDELDGTSAA